MGTKTKPGNSGNYDIDFIRSAAKRQWPAILSSLTSIDADTLDGRHHPCPKCGGSDRFRMIDEDLGAVLCNQCFNRSNGDGFSAIAWMTGEKFGEILPKVANFLGIHPTGGKSTRKKKADPEEHLVFDIWNDSFVGLFCMNKPPIVPDAIKSVGGRVARYRNQFTVLAFPVWGEDWKSESAKPVGWILYNINGGYLPKWSKDSRGNLKTEQVKVKLTHGSEPGIVCNRSVLKSDQVSTVWKTEGSTDLLAFLSMADLPVDTTAITNANGCSERPAAWMLEIFRGRLARVIHDADEPGERGAIGWTDDRGRHRPGWASEIARTAKECRHVRLPFEIQPTSGKDLRDWTKVGNGFNELVHLEENAAIVQPPIGETTSTASDDQQGLNEADDDPHRLARVNLQTYGQHEKGATLRFWRGEWYTWKPSRGCYRKIDFDELEARLAKSIKEEFDRLHKFDLQDSEGEKVPEVRKVTKGLISNVLTATKGEVVLSSTVEPNTFIDQDGNREERSYLAMKNGILDVEGILAGKPEPMIPHTPEWFSTICLPYEFDPEADCPKWLAFLEKNLAGDHELISILQEWAGYCLLPTTEQQKFIFFEGEGSNGKSVYLGAIEALVGSQNCSQVTLESFGQRFGLTPTIGKLVNISAEINEIDSVAEGHLKSFTSGDTMQCDRKGLPAISVKPTARLILSGNVKPRFNDKTRGIWRRMIVIPWRVKIEDHEKVYDMDKSHWWVKSGELPGMLNWALAGLSRLRRQRSFSRSKVAEAALREYRNESNPAGAFLTSNYLQDEDENKSVECSEAYEAYRDWMCNSGHRGVMSDNSFGKEVIRAFPNSKRKRIRKMDNQGITKRVYVYTHLKPGNPEDEEFDRLEREEERKLFAS